ncbi:MAG: BCCT family transporter [Myxococcales bacterium]|nr:BCCT family transporter [Myxococcales bacterium]
MSAGGPAAQRRLGRVGLATVPARIAAGTVACFLVATLLSIESASDWLGASKDAVIRHFDWLFVAVATLAVATVAILALHPRANVRLGPPDARPEFGRLAWFAMLFSAGLASGLLYWATAEPILHHQGNPLLAGLSDEAAPGAAVQTAMRITILHWGLHGWAFYVLAGLGIAIYGYRHGRPLSFRTAFHPTFGADRLERWPGHALDLVALFGTVCGVATSIGLSAAALNATLGSLLDVAVGVPNQIVIVAAVCLLGVASAVSGLARGIRRLSEVNLWVSAALLLAFVALGPTAFLGELFLDTTTDYLRHALSAGAWLADTPEQKRWQASWTVFYWGWWLAWTPFVGLFIARISRGRTVREFAVAVMGVPALVILLWMSIFGGTALHQEIADPGAVSAAVNQDYSLGIAVVIANLAQGGVGTGLMLAATFLLLTWLVTSLDSATLVICHLVGAGEAPAVKAFWGLALAATTAALLLVGGLSALQSASILVGLPLALLMVLLAGGILWDLARDRF